MADDEPIDEQEPGTDLVKVEVPRPALVSVELGVGEFLGRVLGRPLEQAGGVLADLLGIVRFEMSIPYLKRAQRVLRDAGLDQEPLPPVDLTKLLPILEWGSLQPAESSMREQWDNLLANALVACEEAHPAYADILRQLAPREAALLDGLFDQAMADGGELGSWGQKNLPAAELTERVGLTVEANDVARNNLFRLRVCRPINVPYPGSTAEDPARVLLIGFGNAFVRACRPPAPGR